MLFFWRLGTFVCRRRRLPWVGWVPALLQSMQQCKHDFSFSFFFGGLATERSMHGQVFDTCFGAGAGVPYFLWAGQTGVPCTARCILLLSAGAGLARCQFMMSIHAFLFCAAVVCAPLTPTRTRILSIIPGDFRIYCTLFVDFSFLCFLYRAS